MLDTIRLELRFVPGVLVAVLLVAVLFVAGNGPSHGQEPDAGEATQALEPASNARQAAAEPVVTRAWAHDDFGRIVFDWPRAVAYGARIEEKTLTVMFDRHLKTTFQQIPRNLGAYITAVDLGPDGHSVVAALTGDYRLRTFILGSHSPGVRIVVDLLTGAEPMTQGEVAPMAMDGEAATQFAQLAQADPPLPEPTPEAVPEAMPVDVPPLEAQAASENTSPDTPPVGADPSPEPMPEITTEVVPEITTEDMPLAETQTAPVDLPPLKADEDTPPVEAEAAPEPTPETVPETTPEAAPPVKADADVPPAQAEAAPEAVPVDAPAPPAETEAAPVAAPVDVPADAPAAAEAAPETVPVDASPAETQAAPETVPETTPEAAPPVKADAAVPPAETPATPEPIPAPAIASPASLPVAVVADASLEAESTPTALRIPVSHSRLFRLDTPVASVFVANPEIANVQLVSSNVLFVVGKAVGRTSVAALDADSKLIGEWTISTVIDVEPTRAALKGVAALKHVTVRQLNRGVELSGTVVSIAEADLALRLTTSALPDEIPIENRITVSGTQQVNLEVQIAEVQRSVSETLGFNWEVLPNIGGGGSLGFRVGRFFFDETVGFIAGAGLAGQQSAAVFGSTGGPTTVRGLIDALATAGLATVLARPNVTAVSGETASFFSGGEYPLPAGFEDGAIIFEYKKYGVLLDFVPTIVDSGRIVLTVRPEVSQRSDTDSLTVVGIDIPVINVRRAETTVEVGNGESIVIAGLYRDQSEAVEAGVPFLKDIPLINLLFGTQTVRSNATELIVVVTARLTDAAPMPRPANRQAPGRRLHGYHY